MKLIVGLGNPGKEYDNTRHNMGFIMVNEILKKYNLVLDKEKFNGKYTYLTLNNEKIYFLEPQTYMNLSGECLRDFINYYKIDIDDILVIYDDIDLDLGRIRLKKKSSSGGHNGIKNIIEHLHTDEFKRLKVGVSNNKNINTKDYVLGQFNKKEKEEIEDIKKRVLNLFEDYLKIDFDLLMKKYN